MALTGGITTSSPQLTEWSTQAGFPSTPKGWAGVLVYHCFDEAGVDADGILAPPLTVASIVAAAKAKGAIVSSPKPGCIVATGKFSSDGGVIAGSDLFIFVSGSRSSAKLIGVVGGKVAQTSRSLPVGQAVFIRPAAMNEGS